MSTSRFIVLCGCILAKASAPLQEASIASRRDAHELLALLEAKASASREAVQLASSSQQSCFTSLFAAQSSSSSSEALDCSLLSQDEHARSSTAVLLTLCELRGASSSIPKECEPLEAPKRADERIARRCVEALHRSPQAWSSYSGYLREVVQVCHAFHRWHEIDIAKEVHVNITHQVTTLLTDIQDLERRRCRAFSASEAHGAEERALRLANEEALTKSLAALAEVVDAALDGVRGSDGLFEAVGRLMEVSERAFTASRAIDEERQREREVERQASEAFLAKMSMLPSDIAAEATASLQAVSSSHAASLSHTISSASNHLSSELTAVTASHREGLKDVLEVAREHQVGVMSDVQAVTNALQILSAGVDETAKTLTSRTEDAALRLDGLLASTSKALALVDEALQVQAHTLHRHRSTLQSTLLLSDALDARLRNLTSLADATCERLGSGLWAHSAGGWGGFVAAALKGAPASPILALLLRSITVHRTLSAVHQLVVFILTSLAALAFLFLGTFVALSTGLFASLRRLVGATAFEVGKLARLLGNRPVRRRSRERLGVGQRGHRLPELDVGIEEALPETPSDAPTRLGWTSSTAPRSSDVDLAASSACESSDGAPYADGLEGWPAPPPQAPSPLSPPEPRSFSMESAPA